MPRVREGKLNSLRRGGLTDSDLVDKHLKMPRQRSGRIMKPWEYHPELTPDRLTIIAQLIEEGRSRAVARHDPSDGDNGWLLGCSAYCKSVFQIKQAAGTSGYDWLSVVDEGNEFQFGVGGITLRFRRDNPSGPREKISTPTQFEQLQLDLEPDAPTAGMIYRIIVTADADGSLLSADFVAFRAGIPEATWHIPLSDSAPPIVVLDGTRPEGRELDAPVVGDQYEDYERQDGTGSLSDQTD